MERWRDDVTLQIRKLRKKLRQIEHLESIERELSDEELTKCIKKESLRETLLQLLAEEDANNSAHRITDTTQVNPIFYSDYSGLESNTSTKTDFSTSLSESTDFSTSQSASEFDGNVPYTAEGIVDCSGTADDVEEGSRKAPSEAGDGRRSESSPTRHITGNDGKTGPNMEQQKQQQRNCSPKRQQAEAEQTTSVPTPSKKSKATQKVQSPKSPPNIWHSSGFVVTALESHNDLVTSVDCCGAVFVTGSRDTTIKIWDMKTLTELRSLGSHTGSVTDVMVIAGSQLGQIGEKLGLETNDSLVLSVSMDCSLNLWSVNTGELLKSIYTYNPITKVAFYKEQSLAVTASDGGKLELWDLVTKNNVCSETAHADAITGLCVDNNRIFTSCGVEGEIKVFEVRDQELHCLFVSENVRSPSGGAICMRHVRALNVKGDNLMYGDDGVNLKILSWKTGVVKKLANHKEEFGITDAICCHGDVMVTSAYDLDRGQGYVNVFDTSTSAPRYLSTVDTEETGRIFSIACSRGDDKYVTMVTAGVELLVWRQVPLSRSNPDVIATRYVESLSQPAQDSDLESDVEFSDSDDDDVHPDHIRRGSAGSTTRQGWFTWCSIV